MSSKLIEASAVVFFIFASFAALSSLGIAAAPAQYHPPNEIYPQGSGSGLDADTVDAKHAADLQARVSGACSSGNAIRVINADGSVSCQSTSGGSGTVTSVGSGTGLAGGPITTSGALSIANPSKGCGGGTAIQSFDLSNGNAPSCVSVGGGGSGTVTSVGTGTGLTGGPITTSGTISLNLGSANTWTAAQTFTTVTASAGVSASSTGNAIVGNGANGVYGIGTGSGVYGLGIGSANGVYGLSGSGTGVYGDSAGTGVYGHSTGNTGVIGQTDSGWAAVYGQGPTYGVFCNGNYCGGTRAWTVSSDERLKKNITTIENALDKVEKLHGVIFEWKNSNKTDIGFIAQEVKGVIPEVVSRNADGYYAMESSQLTAVLVEAIKEQQKQIESLKEEIELLKSTK